MSVIDENRHLEEMDKKYVWHPFTQMKEWTEETSVIISEGRDSFIKDIYGRWYIDGVSSIWVNVHGHRRREIDEAIKGQLQKVAHSTLLGLGNVPSIRLAEKVITLMNGSMPSLKKVFYSDNGSTAVEIALKMAFQYWRLKGINGKHSFVGLRNAYHGDTIGAVSVGGIEVFHSAFGPLLFKTHKAPSPYCFRCETGLERASCEMQCLKGMERILKAHSSEIAAVIVEPVVQAAGGMIVAPEGFLKGVRELCDLYGVLLIADEVATGFGRTGTMFASEREGVSPDIMCLSKGITGGYMPLALTVCTDEIYDAFLGSFGETKTFFHGHSYTGNPLACAAGLACLDVFEKDGTLGKLKEKTRLVEKWLNDVGSLPHVGDARGAGMMVGVELVKDKKTKEPYPYEERWGWRVSLKAREKGVIIRPLGNVVVVMPPLSISTETLDALFSHVKNSIEEVTARGV